MPRTVTEDMIHRVLGDDFLALSAAHYQLKEEIGNNGNDGMCRVAIRLRHTDKPPGEALVEGSGVGFIDAAFHALMAHFAHRFRSLETITFTKFEVLGKMDTGNEQGLDAEAVVTLQVKNSEGRQFTFEHSGRSTVAATLQVVIETAEFFINSERAFVKVHEALTNARERDRYDLIQSYTAQLAELVKTTSYSEVIERIRREAL